MYKNRREKAGECLGKVAANTKNLHICTEYFESIEEEIAIEWKTVYTPEGEGLIWDAPSKKDCIETFFKYQPDFSFCELEEGADRELCFEYAAQSLNDPTICERLICSYEYPQAQECLYWFIYQTKMLQPAINWKMKFARMLAFLMEQQF